MSTTDIQGGRLFQFYARYVGEPESKKDVYGYWLFLLGAVVSFVGVLMFLTLPTDTAELLFRGLSIGLSAAGLPLALLGIVLLVPVKRRSIWVTVLGSLVALAAVAAFVWAYPDNWPPIRGEFVDYSTEIIGAYAVGMAVMVGVAVLVPIVTGEKSLFFEQEYERERDYPPVVVGEALRGGLFTVYRDGKEWTWRLIDQEAVAGSVDDYLSKLETEESVDRIKEKVEQAGLLEIKHAAFRLYEAAEDSWQWVLMSADGSILAESDGEYESRNVAADAVNDLKEFGPTAELVDIEGTGAFEFTERSAGIDWRLVDEDRSPIAEGPETYDSREAAESGTELARLLSDDARTLAIETIAVELYEDEGAAAPWYWRLLDADDTELATSVDGFGKRRIAEEAVYDLLESVDGAPVLSEEPAFEVTPATGGGWQWELLDRDEDPVAVSHETAGARHTAEDHARTLGDRAADAEIVSIENAEFEYYRSGEGWHWRLVTEDRQVLATSTEAFETEDDAARAIDEVQEQASEADLIEFENAAFQLYETGEEWRWRLIDEDGNMMADSGEEHDSRDSAAASMMTIKEQAPDADVLEIETAAFELFHDEQDNWNWRLVDEGGETTARGPRMLPTEEEAREAMDRLVGTAEDSDARAMEDAVFQVYAADEEWRWQFVLPDGTIVADGEDTYGTRDEAVSGIQSEIREVASAADVHAIEEVALRIDARGDRYSWRVIDTDRDSLAVSSRAHADREDAVAEVQQFRDNADDASVFDLAGPAFQLQRTNELWRWRLIDEDREEIMRAPGGFETREAAEAAIERVEDIAPDAGVLDYDAAAFELLEEDGRWYWQLIDEDGLVLASGANNYSSRDAAAEALEDVRAELEEASILEIEIAAFEIQEDDGQWRWRLIDENGTPMAQSVRSYDSRREARESMELLKEHAPDALTSVAE